MANPTQSAIIYPEKFLPGTVDNWVSNERIVKNISAQQIWDLLVDISKWPSYYKNVSQITQPSKGPILAEGSVFKFSTFGFPILECPVEECTPPSSGKPGRIAWSAKLDGSEDEKVEVYHAWLVEDLEGGRVRILTQESQIGKPAAQLEGKKPNVMLLGHQDWCNGLVEAAQGKKVTKETETNLGAARLLAY